MPYKVIAKLDEQKYKSCDTMDSTLWHFIKDDIYTLSVWPTFEMAKWSAKNQALFAHSNLDIFSIRIIKI